MQSWITECHGQKVFRKNAGNRTAHKPAAFILTVIAWFDVYLYAEQYSDNKPFQEKHKKSKDPDKYLQMHETQLILFDAAERMLLKMRLDPKSANIEEIRADYKEMLACKAVS